MQPVEVGSKVLQSYGLIGFLLFLIVIFSVYVVKRVLDFLMAQSESKDKAAKEERDAKDRSIQEMSSKFAAALDGNTKAMQSLNEGVGKLHVASDTMVSGFNRLADQGREEHGRILDHIKRTGT